MAGTPASEAAPQPPSDETKAIVNAAWDNHFAAFGAQDVEKILADYSEESEIRVYDQTTGEKKLFVGLEGVREAFVGLFASLPDLSALAAPLVDVSEARSQVLLVWECPSSGVVRATDTFLFDAAGKIVTQNVVLVTKPVVQPAWDNHFAAFGAQDLDRILLDYCDTSIIKVWDNTAKTKTTYNGLDGARE